MKDEEKIANGYFDEKLTTGERACFEAGIKLGAIFHSILAIPIQDDPDILDKVERGLEAAFSSQPYVKRVSIRVDPRQEKNELNRESLAGNQDKGNGPSNTPGKRHEFDYTIIKEEMVDVTLEIGYENVDVLAKITWVPELAYPLMHVERISRKSGPGISSKNERST